jgi:FkbM family methyltransferase
MQTRLRYLYRAYRYRYRIDRAELRFVRDSLRPGQVAVDIGCHKGAYTYWMQRCVGPTGRVYAFEPQPQQVAYLQQAFATLPFENVVLVPMAVSDGVGQALLHMPTRSGGTHAATLEPGSGRWEQEELNSLSNVPVGSRSAEAVLSVDVTTLDDFFSNRAPGPAFLKIDVEGHELAVLQGGRNVLVTNRPTLLLECETRHRPNGDVRPVFEFLKSLAYDGTFFHHGRRRPLAEFDPTKHQHVDPTSTRLPRGYVNNFAFVPVK